MKRQSFSLLVLLLAGALLPFHASAQTTNLRGVMISPSVQASDLQYLGQSWKANLVRWQLTWSVNLGGPADTATSQQYDAWLETALQKLDSLLPVCQQNGLKVLIDLHTTPGGRSSDYVDRIFTDAGFQNQFLLVWNKIAQRYAGNPTVWGYDLANEPVQPALAAGLLDWHQLAERTATNIRGIDPGHVIVVEPDKWAASEGFTGFQPLAPTIPNVIYSVHMYAPHSFTHQGVLYNVSVRYPGIIDQQTWNKDQIRNSLKPVSDFQKKYGVPILVGEFSAARWAPAGSAYRYLKDAIAVFEENGWDWSYHAFREWQGWSVEHSEDASNTNPSATMTNREKLLRQWFGKNAAP